MSSQDRRSHHRYNTHNLKVLVKTADSDHTNWQTGEISSVDFNRYGIALETAHTFSIGDVLSMVIRTDDATIAEVRGIICNRREIDDIYRYGIQFENVENALENNKGMAVNEELLMIERQVAGVVH